MGTTYLAGAKAEEVFGNGKMKAWVLQEKKTAKVCRVEERRTMRMKGPLAWGDKRETNEELSRRQIGGQSSGERKESGIDAHALRDSYVLFSFMLWLSLG